MMIVTLIKVSRKGLAYNEKRIMRNMSFKIAHFPLDLKFRFRRVGNFVID